MLNIGPMELLVVLVVALVVLGPDRLPQASRQLGRAMSELRRWSRRLDTEVRTALDQDAGGDATPSPPADDRAAATPRRLGSSP